MGDWKDENQAEDPGLYPYLPYENRPKITWPGGKRLAFWVAPNIEFYELNAPMNMSKSAWARPAPDTQAYGHRDYGNRVGVWRMIDVMAELGIRGSVSLNVAVCDHHPEIIARCVELGWELFSHGVYNTRFVLNMTRDQEARMVRDVIATVKRASGQSVDGWLSPSLSNNPWTMELLAEHGVQYTCDLFHDDQPRPITLSGGHELISVPYSLELNDILVYQRAMKSPREYAQMIRDQFDRLYTEGAESGTVMCIPLHPFTVGQPHRLAAFADAVAYIMGHDGVWAATGREIAAHFKAEHAEEFDAAAAAYEGN